MNASETKPCAVFLGLTFSPSILGLFNYQRVFALIILSCFS